MTDLYKEAIKDKKSRALQSIYNYSSNEIKHLLYSENKTRYSKVNEAILNNLRLILLFECLYNKSTEEFISEIIHTNTKDIYLLEK